MNIFDSKSNKKWAGSGINIVGDHLVFGQAGKAEILVGRLKYDSVLKIVGKKRSGNGSVGIKVISKDKTIIFDEEITFTQTSWSEKSFDISPILDSNGPCTLRIYRPKGSFGRVEVARALIISNIPRNLGQDEETSGGDIISSDRMTYILDHYFNFSTKIAIIVPYAIYGGAEVYIKNIISNINFKFIKFDIICLRENKISNILDLKNVNFFTSRGLESLRARLISSDYDSIIYYNSLMVYRLLENMVDNKEISSKVVEIYHSDFSWPDALSNINNRRGIDKIIRVSDSLLNYLSGIDGSCIRTVPVGIDVGKFRRRESDELRGSLGIPRESYIFGTVARLSPEKNILHFIEIAKSMKKHVFLIIGSGPDDSKLKMYCLKNNILNVKFLGHKNDVESYYSLFDAFILTSKMEGTPISILEAMASGTPVFSTKVGGIPSIIRDGYNGYFLSGNADNDAATIESNFKNKDVVINAKKYVEGKHNIENISKSFLEEIIFEPKFYSRQVDESESIVLNGVYV